VEVPCEEFGSVKMPSVFPVLSETPGEIAWPGAKIGAYNEDVYQGLLGMSAEELAELKEKGVI
jgi:formyl-CoA transferase